MERENNLYPIWRKCLFIEEIEGKKGEAGFKIIFWKILSFSLPLGATMSLYFFLFPIKLPRS